MQETRVPHLGLEDSLEKEMAPPILYSCLGNQMERGAWRVRVHGVTKESDMTEQPNNNKFLFYHIICSKAWICAVFSFSVAYSMKVLVAQSCLTLCNPMNYSPPDFSVPRFLQARILEWVAISFTRGSSQPRDPTWVSRIADSFFTVWATVSSLFYTSGLLNHKVCY